MSRTNIKNKALSVRQKLLNKAKENSQPFDEVLQYYAMERFLFRLSQSAHTKSLILKGALMFVAWQAPRSRATRDIDFLGVENNSLENISRICKEILDTTVVDDGLIFLPETISATEIQKQRDYPGVQITFYAKLENARIPLQIDVGFDDVVHPKPTKIVYPTILDLPTPVIFGYSPESVIAEKFHTLIVRDTQNSRLKDYFDLWYLSQYFEFDFEKLQDAVRKTFVKRRTQLIAKSSVFNEEYFAHPENQSRWVNYLSRNKIRIAPANFDVVIQKIFELIEPLASDEFTEKPTKWSREKGWH